VATAARPLVVAAGEAVLLAGEPHQLGVHSRAVVTDPEVVQPAVGHHVLPQRHRPVLLDDDLGRAAHRAQPVAELLRVADGRRQ